MGAFRQHVAIDLGTATFLMYVEKKGITVNQSSLVTTRRNTDRITALGDESKNMLGRINKDNEVIQPICGGVISRYTLTKKMLSYYLNKSIKSPLHRIFKPEAMIAIPVHTTNVQKRAVERAAQEAGCSRVFMIEEPLAAAIGAGLDVSKPEGRMIVDIGGGTTDIAVLSYNGVVVGKSLRVAGDAFDAAITQFIKNKFSIQISPLEAENIKKKLVCLYPSYEQPDMEIHGSNVVNGEYEIHTITSEEMMEPLMETVVPILDCIRDILEETPPDLVGDIKKNGILMTGNGSLLRGFDELIHKSTGVDAIVAEEPGLCVVRGAYKVLANMTEEQKSKA